MTGKGSDSVGKDRKRVPAGVPLTKNHSIKCAPPKVGTTIEDHIPGAKYSKALMRLKLLTWVVRRHRPYAIVEDPELLEIFQMLYARVDVPSARTISRDVQEVFKLSKHNLVSMLKVRVLYIYFIISKALIPGVSGEGAHRLGWMDVAECPFIPQACGVHAPWLGARLPRS